MNLPRKYSGLLALAILFLVGFAFAQTTGIISSSAIGLHPIVNSPYAATEETEHTQTLADGTHIVTKNRQRLYRDSAGRTRREMSFPSDRGVVANQGPFSIMIEDPVAGAFYSLQTQNHVAHVMHPFQRPPSNNGANHPQPPRVPPDSLIPKFVTEKLGTQTIDGLEVQGNRTTRTFPAGSRGNDAPIAVTSETWYSEELHLTILTKVSDPRSGETVTRITSLDRSEPDPALFQIPPDYSVVEQ